MPKRSSKKDLNETAASIVRQATSSADIASEATNESTPAKALKNPAAVALGRLGGLKGGKARADKLSARQRSEIAKRAAAQRWKPSGSR